ncbi:hypothetical protein ACFL2D_00090 [Patescibacteria group bacterium]
MSKGTIGVLAILGVGVLAVLIVGGMALGYRGDCVRAEAGIKAQYKQNQNNYDNMWKKFKEMAQVPEMYTADLKSLYDGAIGARYGAEGSKAAMQWIQEQNPNLDPSMYTKLQSAIEAGRNSFEANQRDLLSKKQAYEIVLNGNRALIAGIIVASYPTIDLDDYDIVTSDDTATAFATGTANEVDLRP